MPYSCRMDEGGGGERRGSIITAAASYFNLKRNLASERAPMIRNRGGKSPSWTAWIPQVITTPPPAVECRKLVYTQETVGNLETGLPLGLVNSALS